MVLFPVSVLAFFISLISSTLMMLTATCMVKAPKSVTFVASYMPSPRCPCNSQSSLIYAITLAYVKSLYDIPFLCPLLCVAKQVTKYYWFLPLKPRFLTVAASKHHLWTFYTGHTWSPVPEILNQNLLRLRHSYFYKASLVIMMFSYHWEHSKFLLISTITAWG